MHGNAEKHFCRPSFEFRTGIDDIEKFPCSWEIHDGENNFKFAEDIIRLEKITGAIGGTLINESNIFLSEIKNGKSVASINYSNTNGHDNIIVCLYFSHKIFLTIVDFLKFSCIINSYKYIFNLDFMGFASNSISEDGRFISYDRWIDGSPYYTEFLGFKISDYSELSCQSS